MARRNPPGSHFGCFFICFSLGSLVRMRRCKMTAFACPCPSPMSDLSYARSSECFATILPFFTRLGLFQGEGLEAQ